MEPGKSSISETSNNLEDDHNQEHEKPKEDENSGIGRSYECTFCKRGFTNAQALGGHMNIHRKDKAVKSKHKPRNIHNEPSVSLIGNVDYSRYFPGDPSISSEIRADNYKVYLPSSNPNLQTANNVHPVTMDFGQKEGLGLTEENLSLKFVLTSSTPTIEEIRGEQNVKKNDEVDLELRLGHDP